MFCYMFPSGVLIFSQLSKVPSGDCPYYPTRLFGNFFQNNKNVTLTCGSRLPRYCQCLLSILNIDIELGGGGGGGGRGAGGGGEKSTVDSSLRNVPVENESEKKRLNFPPK